MHCPFLHLHSYSVIHVFLLKQNHFEVQIVFGKGGQGDNFYRTKDVVIIKQVLPMTSAWIEFECGVPSFFSQKSFEVSSLASSETFGKH